MGVWFVSTRANTGNATINVAQLGVKNIRRFDGSDLNGGELKGIVHLVYNGTAFIIDQPINYAVVNALPDSPNDNVFYFIPAE